MMWMVTCKYWVSDNKTPVVDGCGADSEDGTH